MGILAENVQESSSLVKIIIRIKRETIFKVLPCVVDNSSQTAPKVWQGGPQDRGTREQVCVCV
jgi:hypothetical protein